MTNDMDAAVASLESTMGQLPAEFTATRTLMQAAIDAGSGTEALSQQKIVSTLVSVVADLEKRIVALESSSTQ